MNQNPKNSKADSNVYRWYCRKFRTYATMSAVSTRRALRRTLPAISLMLMKPNAMLVPRVALHASAPSICQGFVSQFRRPVDAENFRGYRYEPVVVAADL